MIDLISNEKFLEDLQQEDELGAVIRAHLYIERIVNEILRVVVPFPESLKSLRLDFNGKLSVICAMGMKEETKKCFSQIGRLRNRFAHEPNYRLTKSDTNSLYKSLEKEDKNLVQKCYRDLSGSSPEWKDMPQFKKLSARDQFTLIAIVVKTIAVNVLSDARSKSA